ncbi:T9SS type A sorting domain-containing protein [Flammeovirga kamogawensis]|uniref:T9SS type A sorting domain-containing protein n=1 Tax=Flammeovirga kamogawensis TaxID=373891 RepID=A0ABX8H1F7_9BACT|nr:T9SS type A sorting domain-containing protein [Flammeovirga kamogawensis]MBB6463759.1 hypothetical protein [Flammeovirga kamogawensis]QWG09729.1 T9SS type A sorting domain-containing protein [Flammeovirga kamogawensis]TRX65242.1 T9SS type A sorting domain-containing protein [Flammeovirga kamogawensis]
MKKYILLIFASFLIASCTTLDSETLSFNAIEPLANDNNITYIEQDYSCTTNVNSGNYVIYNNSQDTTLKINFDNVIVSDAAITLEGNGKIRLIIKNTCVFDNDIFTRNNKNYKVVLKKDSRLIINEEYDITNTGDDKIIYDESDLPVELISFDSKLINNQVQLNWSTATEINSNNFEVQRSIDTRNWTVISDIKAAGNSNTKLDYQYIDSNLPVASVVYYRLVETDLDGLSQTFGPNAIYLEQTENTVSVYPNPVNYGENIHIVSTYDDMDIRIFDASGRTYAEFETEYNHIELPMTYGQGILFIEVKSGAAITTEKVIVR